MVLRLMVLRLMVLRLMVFKVNGFKVNWVLRLMVLRLMVSPEIGSSFVSKIWLIVLGIFSDDGSSPCKRC